MEADGSQKRCCRCAKLKERSAFSFKNSAAGVLHEYCRECHKAWNRGHYERNRATYISNARRNTAGYLAENLRRIVEYLQVHPCVDCGETDLLVLEFDHRDRSTKRLPVSLMVRDYAWAQIALEIAKCDVRCANDHRRRTARQLGWRKAALEVVQATSG